MFGMPHFSLKPMRHTANMKVQGSMYGSRDQRLFFLNQVFRFDRHGLQIQIQAIVVLYSLPRSSLNEVIYLAEKPRDNDVHALSLGSSNLQNSDKRPNF